MQCAPRSVSFCLNIGAPVYAGRRCSSSSNLTDICQSNRHFRNDSVMMLRILVLILTLFTGLAHANATSVLQQPISLETTSGEIRGSLLLPQSTTPPPIVLIIAGSGPSDRDGNNPQGGRNDSLKLLAWMLAKHNIASVRYDKR